MAPLRFFSLISLGGILFKLSASHGTMVTSLFSNWEFFFFVPGGLMNIKWGVDQVRIDVGQRCPYSRYHVVGC